MVTSAEQHAATIRETVDLLCAQDIRENGCACVPGATCYLHGVMVPERMASLDALVALAQDPKTHPFSTGMDYLARAEAAEQRSNELERDLGYLVERCAYWEDQTEQARREADQLRAALEQIDKRDEPYFGERTAEQQVEDMAIVARAALAGVQAKEQTDA